MGKRFRENEDKQFVTWMKRNIAQRDGHCPSKSDVSQDTLCPCKPFREDGVCECGLYIPKRKKVD